MTSFNRTYPKMAGKKHFRIITDSYGDVFTQKDFEDWYMLNSEYVQKCGRMYIVNEPAQFKRLVLEGNHLNSSFERNYLTTFNNNTLMDLGSEITIGIRRNIRLLVFHLVELPSMDETPTRGYIITENNTVTVKHPRLQVAAIRS